MQSNELHVGPEKNSLAFCSNLLSRTFWTVVYVGPQICIIKTTNWFIKDALWSWYCSVGKKVKRICSPLRESFSGAVKEICQKKNFLPVKIYSSSLNRYSVNQCNTKEKNILQS